MANGELVLLYNLEGDKARKLKMIFAQNRIKIRTVEEKDYQKPIGVLAGVLKEETSEEEAKCTDGIPEEMLVMKGIFGKRLDLLLTAMRKAGAAVPLKAVVTETNMTWNSIELYQEIRKEHEAMTKED